MPRREQPLESGDDGLLRFAGALRQLREKAGRPTYRQLSARAHYSAAALSEAASGRKLPSLQVTLAYVEACGGDTESWAARWRELAADAARNGDGPAEADDLGEAPYVGLAAFQEGDAERFFGRESLVDDLVDRVREHRFFAVFGASGSGKSSVLRAGLATRFPSSEIVIFTPGPHPIEECAVRLAGVVGESAAVLRTELAADPRNLHLRIRQADADVLLIVDQFEELFTLCQDDGERRWLIDALTRAAFTETSRTRVVLGVRADFYGHCGQHPALVNAIRDAQLLVGQMTADELRLAITEPAARAGCRVETALVARLVSDATGQPAVLPLVSHALLETWRRRRGTTLTLTGYETAGGIEHALSRTAEDIYAALDPGQQDAAKRIFLRLIALGDGTEDTKRRVDRHELAEDPGTAALLDRLAAARLVTLDRDTVELTHEALIRHWPRLRGWLAEDRDGQRLHHELTEATIAWDKLGRDPGALYRGARLTRARDWAATRDPTLTASEREFLDTSLSTEARERTLTRRRRRRSRQLIAVFAVLLLIASAATGYAISSQRSASQQRNAALALSALREADLMRVTNPALAWQLTVAAYRLDPTLRARDAMHDMFAAPYATRLTGHANTVSDVAISPNGKLLATTSLGGEQQVRLWDISDPHHPRELPGLKTNATSVAFSSRPGIIATFGTSDKPLLWDITYPDRPRQLTPGGPDDSSYLSTSLAFSPDGFHVATASHGTVRLWDVRDPRYPLLLATVDDALGSASVIFHPAGRVLAVLSGDLTVRLWDVSDPAHPQPQDTRIDGVHAVAFSQNGSLLAAAGADSVTRLWDIQDPRRPVPLAKLTGHSDAVRAVAFSADSQLVATGGADRTTRLWDITDPRAPAPLATLAGHTDVVHAVSFAPGGRTLVTGGADRTARLEDISAIGLANHPSAVYSVAFSADGRKMATASEKRMVRLWDVTYLDRPLLLATIQPADLPAAMAFGADDRFLVTTGVQGGTQGWDLSDPRAPRAAGTVPTPPIRTISARQDGRLVGLTMTDPAQLWNGSVSGDHSTLISLPTEVYLAAFGPGSRILATADQAAVTRLWDISDPDQPRTITILQTRGFPMAFSRDGRLLAIAHQDGTTRLWDVSDLEHPEELSSIATGTRSATIPGPGVKAAFSSDGRHIVTASGDKTARLWDISNPRAPREEATLRGHADNVVAVAFSSDGHTIATAGNDHVVRLWESDMERIAARTCELAQPRITKSEWDQYFPGLEFQPPCR